VLPPGLLDSVELSREFFVSLGTPGLFAVAFLEFFLLPVPPDLVLIPLAAATPELALFYAAVATAGSVSTGLVGYAVGRNGGRPWSRGSPAVGPSAPKRTSTGTVSSRSRSGLSHPSRRGTNSCR
jgi:membrane protein YqaA with SNARE-associated domain